jgi:four helix bundle protein
VQKHSDRLEPAKNGRICADRDRMVARTFEDLEAWQLADALKKEVYRLIATGSASRAFGFASQIRQSAASIPRNIAEGFGRFRPRPFAQFVEIALGSATETLDALRDGVDRGYFAEADTTRAIDLAKRTIQMSTRLVVYLKNCPPDGPGKKRRRS